MIYIEPIMLLPSSEYLTDWLHPKINELTKDLEKNEEGNLEGNLIHAHFEFSDYRQIDVISKTDQQGMENMLTESGPDTFGGQLLILFNEQIWQPEGKPFSLSEYGEIFNFIFPFYFDQFTGYYSNNFSLSKNEERWEFIDHS